MAIPAKQIGQSAEANLLWQISKQLETLIKVTAANGSSPSTTTSTSTTSVPSYSTWTAYIGINNVSEACFQDYASTITFYTSVNSITNGTLVWADSALTIPLKSEYSNFNYYKIQGENVSYEAISVASGTVLTNSTPC